MARAKGGKPADSKGNAGARKPAASSSKAARAKPSRKGVGGRPSGYSPERAAQICALIAEGLSLRKICAMDGMPDKSTVFNWLARYPEFVDQYARARELGSEVWAEEMLDIADDGTNDWVEKLDRDGNPTGQMVFHHEHVQRSKLRVDTRKWLLAKLQPKKYGDKIDLNHGGQADNPVRSLIEQVAGNTLRPVSDEDPEA